MRLFGRKKEKPTVNDTIFKLQTTVDMIEKREHFLEKKIRIEMAVATQFAKTDRRKALFSLKKKKMYELQITKLEGMRMNIESQVLQLEQAGMTAEVVSAMKLGADSLKGAFGDIKVENVDSIMEDITESMDAVNEITDVISGGFSVDDDDEILAELDALVAESQIQEMPEIPTGRPTRIILPASDENQTKTNEAVGGADIEIHHDDPKIEENNS